VNAITNISASLASKLAQYAPGETRALEGHYLDCINRQVGGVSQPKLALMDRSQEREVLIAALAKWRTFRELKALIGTDQRVTLNLLQSLRATGGLETTGPRNERIYRMVDAGRNGEVRDA